MLTLYGSEREEEVEEGGGEMDRASLLIHRSEVDERRAAGDCPLELKRQLEFYAAWIPLQKVEFNAAFYKQAMA